VCCRCSVLQCVAVCCSVLQCVAVCCSVSWRPNFKAMRAGPDTASSCNALQHAATRSNTQQHAATHSDALEYTVTHSKTRRTAIYCKTQQDTTHCNALQETARQRQVANTPSRQCVCSRASCMAGQPLQRVAVCCSVLECVEAAYLQDHLHTDQPHVWRGGV